MHKCSFAVAVWTFSFGSAVQSLVEDTDARPTINVVLPGTGVTAACASVSVAALRNT